MTTADVSGPASWGRSLLRPDSVAIVGASDRVFTFSGASIHNLREHGWTGRIHPVNPGRDEVQGLRAWPSITAIEDTVDTAVVCVPPNAVLEVLRECEARGVGTATVVTAGFEAGAGPDGPRRARKLRDFLDTAELRVLGPNTAGLVNALDDYVPRAAVNHVAPDVLRAGPVAVVTQSGACSNILFNRAQANGVAVGTVVATGNELDLDIWDVIELLLDDDRVHCVLVVMEAFSNGARAREVAHAALARNKPIVLLQLGRSAVGQEVVRTHSGSLAGDATTIGAALRSWGVVIAATFDELWEFARLVQNWGPPSPAGGRLGIFAFSGGEAALAADHCDANGVRLAATSDAFAAVVDDTMAFATPANPFDATGELVGRPDKLAPVFRSFALDNDFTSVLVATPVYRREAADRVLPVLAEALAALPDDGVRIAISMWPCGILTNAQAAHLEKTGCPVLNGSDRAVAAIGAYEAYGGARADRLAVLAALAPERPRAVPVAISEPTYAGARKLLTAIGLPFVPALRCTTRKEAVAAGRALGHPVVVKGDVASTVHKDELGLVRVGVATDEDLAAAFDEMQHELAANGTTGVVVEAMAFGNVELILGMHRDPQVGPVAVVGLGGSVAEYVADHTIAPVGTGGPDWARAAITATGVGRFLRDRFPAVLGEVASQLAAVATWFVDHDEVQGIDLNPVIVDTGRSQVSYVDARIDVAPPTPVHSPRHQHLETVP